MEHRRTRVGSFVIHSVHAGSGPPVVLLHGLSGSHSWWLKTIPALSATFQVHVPELVGFGASRKQLRQPDIPEMAQLVGEWMAAQGLARAHLVGHSMGGQVSIHLAASSPASIERLVLVSASGIPRPRSVRELGRFVTELARPRAWTRPRFARTLVVDALRAGPRVLALSARYILGDDVRPLLPAIPHRTLVLWGALDALTPRAHGVEMAAALPDARLLVLPRAAHIPMVECPVEFNEALLDFLAEP